MYTTFNVYTSIIHIYICVNNNIDNQILLKSIQIR